MRTKIMFVLEMVCAMLAGYIADFLNFDILVYLIGVIAGIIGTTYVFVESNTEKN